MFSSDQLITIVVWAAVVTTANATADPGTFTGCQQAWTSRFGEH